MKKVFTYLSDLSIPLNIFLNIFVAKLSNDNDRIVIWYEANVGICIFKFLSHNDL